ncbi:MAG TPA: N-acetyl-1-D-myo-inositol-2-amino-2-deoxy-alpha-D-glucopyranoside deacetylase [Mycobacteriales bacterium]|jgi:N-acetyl-1-D-myo-inositol-2-amino-2-deoxy-alpha-D-glucopyranoside deacetylase|nr:N-acetyl-D-myo-inosityl-2-amino-2-deoxy-alpha-D-glucopyranoside deacetylase MshB [Cryptosporangiaceae bacterium]MDQ1678330.1 N-acetyl-D-myo-inositol-2-amino-2-deoxy-alpha-D-glucopyranoside deacetylase [Actinomycetota bacterium]HEV7756983.1 N-acetyl-1-D-myo-inositol-2-amino-2-deoxy-alpha-D-glucopyranoside deacetylase [Mycobacteriales bacterium]
MTTRRLLLVHAHPDDETVGTGATMARYAAEGAQVTLVTCTLGEEGEVRVPEYAELAADRGNQLGGYRIAELREACRELGVTDHRFLGGPGRYRDSGMMGLPQNENPRSFWQADLDEAAGRLVEILREVRPQVVLTYDPNGFYGHPDHIQAHRVAMRGVELAADPAAFPQHGEAWQVQKVYWTAVPKSFLAAGLERFAGSADNPFGGVTDVADLPFGTPDDEIVAEIDGKPHTAAKLAAMRAHATQIAADDWLFTLAELGGEGALGTEHYTLAVGEKSVADGWETDLFAGTD